MVNFALPKMSLTSIGHFKPAPKPPVDKETEGLKKVGITDAEEVKECKDLFLELREALKKSNEGDKENERGAIDLELFKRVALLPVCQVEETAPEELKCCLNPNLVGREVKQTQAPKSGQHGG